MLDCFLIFVDWEETWRDFIQKRLSCPLSDHYPICLEKLVAHRGKSPFRFENIWLHAEGFTTLINNWWT